MTRLLALALIVATTSCSVRVVEEATEARSSVVDATQEQDVAVTMTERSFEPAEIVITRGTTVTWSNDSILTSTVTSGFVPNVRRTGELFDETVRPSQTFSFTFEEAGEFPYLCRIHGPNGMKGLVRVVDPAQ